MNGANLLNNQPGLNCAWNLQRVLSKAQAIPLIGFVVASPVKLLVSTIEFLAGSIFATIALTFGIIIDSDFLLEFAFTSGAHALLGLGAGLYSFGNMISFGILGLTFETTGYGKL